MTRLSDIEVKLIDEYIIRNQFTEIDQVHFLNALANTVPTWRGEELVGTDHVYHSKETEVYRTYINQLTNAEKT